MEVSVDLAAERLWDYMLMRHEMVPVDMIWALGSHDLRVADRVADLYHVGLAPLVMMSGGLGNFTEGVFEKSEAELFAERSIALGVPEDAILVENRSTNTGENVQFSRELLAENRIDVKSVIAVQKPYMERRTYATVAKQWPEVDVIVSSPQLAYRDYLTQEISAEMVNHILVGDFQRIIEYPKLGFMMEQEVYQQELDAWQILVDAGYTEHLLPS